MNALHQSLSHSLRIVSFGFLLQNHRSTFWIHPMVPMSASTLVCVAFLFLAAMLHSYGSITRERLARTHSDFSFLICVNCLHGQFSVRQSSVGPPAWNPLG